MATRSKGNKLGAWAFFIGIVLAVVISLVAVFSGTSAPSWAIVLLAIIGLIVGLLNVTPAETRQFLIASIAFLLSFSSLAELARVLGSTVATGLGTFFSLMSVFIAPAAAIVALVAIYQISRD